MLTTGSNIFKCSRSLAEQVAKEAGLKELNLASHAKWLKAEEEYWAWEDTQTSGECCRITWSHNTAWVSRHSGRGDDMTEEVAFMFEEYGAQPMEDNRYWAANPRIYGTDKMMEYFSCRAAEKAQKQGD